MKSDQQGEHQLMSNGALPTAYGDIQSEIVALLEAARRAVARNVNALMTACYWEIGRRIVEYEQGGEGRAGYGEALVQRLALDLTTRFGRGFSRQNIQQMRAFYQTWPLSSICQTLSGKSDVVVTSESSIRLGPDLAKLAVAFSLPWSAYVRLLSVKNPAARSFYETEALRCGWTVRQLDRQVNSQFYERTALSFLNLKDEYSESDLEEALIQHLADFLLELGDDFAFVGRQRRLRLDDTWFRIDLLFFHRRLKALVVIDLKVGKFSYADAGQMHLYLNYAREHWMKPGENPPVGLILCAAKGAAEAHYALEGLSNKVLAAEYQTVLPDEKLLADELDRSRQALEARHRAKTDEDSNA